ncbi:MAG: enoyl-CoA hydratase/isomerase family protein, partial [Blastocatellia bacterium]|nr:enoyl-CoA hydratase/isomerase family protein [Blastocatellia bacterium]
MENIEIRKEGATFWLVLNRPDKLNALVGRVREEIFEALDQAEKDPEARVVVITGNGKGFCAGGDIGYMAELQSQQDLEAFSKLLESGRRVVTKIRSLPKPVIAMINGVAAGAGLNLALACDIRIAADTAKFSQAFSKIGLHPDWGGTFFLPRLIGTAKACELVFTGDPIEADQALQIGLVNRVVPIEKLSEVVSEMAEKLAKRPPLAIALAKQGLYKGIESNLDAALDYETEAQKRCFISEDANEGISAFLQKR